MEKIAENDVIEFYHLKGILYSKYKINSILDANSAKKIISLRHEISNNKNQYWIHDITNLKSIDKGGRDVADKHGQDYLFASAVIVNSHITKFIFNTYMKLKSPNFPFQVFTKKEKAIEWLLEIKEKNEQV